MEDAINVYTQFLLETATQQVLWIILSYDF